MILRYLWTGLLSSNFRSDYVLVLRLKILRRGLSIWDLGFLRNKRNKRTREFPSRKPQQVVAG